MSPPPLVRWRSTSVDGQAVSAAQPPSSIDRRSIAGRAQGPLWRRSVDHGLTGAREGTLARCGNRVRTFSDLRDQFDFLETSGAGFDAGRTAEAKRLATTIRVLVHDTAASTSLLRQLGVKDDLRFVDTSVEPFPEPEPGILQVQMGFGLAAVRIGGPSTSP